MKLSCNVFALTLIIIGLLSAAGCLSSSPAPLNHTGISTFPVTPAPSPSPCTAQINASFPLRTSEPFITINPIRHHYFGEILAFNGTTNLEQGEAIQLVIISAIYVPCPKSTAGCEGSVRPCCGGLSDSVRIIAGPCGINTWSWEVNTSEHGFYPDSDFFIEARGINGRVENSSIFTLSGIPQPNLTLNLPENGPDANTLLLSGQANTGNGPDEKLRLTVSSDSGKQVRYTIPVSSCMTGYCWNFTLKKPEVFPYNFYTVNVTSEKNPGIQVVRTFLYNNEPRYYPYSPYGP